jgi:hypothetical protein
MLAARVGDNIVDVGGSQMMVVSSDMTSTSHTITYITASQRCTA